MYDMKQMINGQWTLVFDEILNEGSWHYIQYLKHYHTDNSTDSVYWRDWDNDNTNSNGTEKRELGLEPSIYDIGFMGAN